MKYKYITPKDLNYLGIKYGNKLIKKDEDFYSRVQVLNDLLKSGELELGIEILFDNIFEEDIFLENNDIILFKKVIKEFNFSINILDNLLINIGKK